MARDDDGTEVRIVCGSYRGIKGPVDDVFAKPVYLDVAVPAGTRKVLPVETTSHAFAYVFNGAGDFRDASAPLAVVDGATGLADNRTLVLFDRGDEVVVKAGHEGIRFLLISGQPLKEPVAWYGPVVMNTQEELQAAFRQLEDGTFLREDAKRD